MLEVEAQDGEVGEQVLRDDIWDEVRDQADLERYSLQDKGCREGDQGQAIESAEGVVAQDTEEGRCAEGGVTSCAYREV